MRITFTIFYLCLSSLLFAQDIHFAHIHASPVILNPAMTGLINNGNLRLIANARTQWHSVTNNAYKTMAASVDGKVASFAKNSYLGAGLQFAGDKAGDLGLSKISTGLTLSGLKSLDGRGKHYLTVGLRTSIYRYSVDYNKMVGFSAEPLVEAGAPDAFSFFDFSTGLAWYYNYNRNSTVYFGTALFHINNPNTSFFNRIEDEEIDKEEFYNYEKLYRKFVIHGGGTMQLTKGFTILPSFIFMDQGPHQEINMGSFLKFSKSRSFEYSEAAFYIGAWFRYHIEKDIIGSDAFVAAIRMDLKSTYLTFSFDFNMSTLTVASNGAGGPELSVIQILTVPKDRRKNYKVKCPAF
ncbi:MAG: PorP/SprF family type IX secretion system membrane protein [Saprospiraceae bacterium]